MATIYSTQEVSKHISSDDAWIILHNKLYNVSKYLEDHPGGAGVLLEVAGADATDAFESVGHSESARETLKCFCLGQTTSTEQRASDEPYRPEFKTVVARPILNAKGQSGSKRITWKNGTAITVLGTGSYFLLQRANTGNPLLRSLFVWIRRALLDNVSLRKTSPGSFTIYIMVFGVATVVHIIMSSAVVAWIWNKLDVQPDQTRYPARRPFHGSLSKYIRTHDDQTEGLLHPIQYRSFQLSEKNHVCHNVYRLIFALPSSQDVLNLPTGQHVSIRAQVNGEMVSRSYTPISDIHEKGTFELLVKVYPQGTLTNKYLQKLQVGDKVDVRGPLGMMKYHNGLGKHLIMIAGGTGITPMFQIVKKIVQDPSDQTLVSLLYANNNEDDILLREELDAIATRWPAQVKRQYVLVNAPPGFHGGRGFVTREMIQDFAPSDQTGVKILVCGPPAMVEAQKKNLHSLGFQLPGFLPKSADEVYIF